MISRLLSWLWLRRVEGYGELFRHSPKVVVDAWPGPAFAQPNDQSLRRPPDYAQWRTLMSALEHHPRAEAKPRIKPSNASADMRSGFRWALPDLMEL
jgi:hypothetical protein